MKPENRMVRIRTRLLLQQPWFGSLAMRLEMIADPSIKTMGTDGSELRYNPEWIAKQTDSDLLFWLAHEVMHCALLHPFRCGGRDLPRWNSACDYTVNELLEQSKGFTAPKDALRDRKFDGLGADVIYARLSAQDPNQGKKPDQKPGDQPGSFKPGKDPAKPEPGKGNPGPSGKPEPGKGNGKPEPGQGQGKPSDQPQKGMSEDDWKIAAEQASAITKAAGKTPGDAARASKAAQSNPEDWRAILREFIEATVPSDYAWASPNRRYIAEGLYLPGVVKENLGRLVIGVDTSASIDQPVLNLFAAEITAILHEANPSSVDVIYCDSAVRHTESFTPDDEKIELHAKGGGGTRFQSMFDKVAEAEEPPIAMLVFTDMENGREVVTEPEYPTLWVTGKRVTIQPPFGQVIRIDF